MKTLSKKELMDVNGGTNGNVVGHVIVQGRIIATVKKYGEDYVVITKTTSREMSKAEYKEYEWMVTK